MNVVRYLFYCLLLTIHCLSLASLFHYNFECDFSEEKQRKEEIFNNLHEQENLEVEFVNDLLNEDDTKELVIFKNPHQNQITTLIKYLHDCCKNRVFPSDSFPVSIGQLSRDLKFKQEKILIIKITEVIEEIFQFQFDKYPPNDAYNLTIFPFYRNVISRNGQVKLFDFHYNRPENFTSKNIGFFWQNQFYAINQYKNAFVEGSFNFGDSRLLRCNILLPWN